MTSRGGEAGAPSRLELDHVLIAVSDLEHAAGALRRDHGLEVLPGGRHPGQGTANAIIPLRGCYVELIAVVDPAEAAGGRVGRSVSDAIASGRGLLGWCVRAASLLSTARHLSRIGLNAELARGSRLTPGGTLLTWMTLTPRPRDDMAAISPFFIAWDGDPEMHPGAGGWPAQGSITNLGIGHPDPLRAGRELDVMLRREIDFDLRAAPVAGLLEVSLMTPHGPATLR